MPENNQILSVEGQLVGMPLAGPESFSQQQLDYLKRALGVDETVLWEGELVVNTSNSLVLSEVVTNFESIAIYDKTLTDNSVSYTKTITSVNANTRTFATRDGWVDVNWQPTNTGSHYIGTCMYVLDADHKTLRTYGCYRQNMSTQTWASTTGKIVKVVGIHRISGGN